MVNDDDRTPEGDDAEDAFRASSSELSDALGDLMASEPDDEDDGGGLDLSALEEAVAELGLDVGDGPEPTPPGEPDLGGPDLSDLPPPPASATPASPASDPAPAPTADELLYDAGNDGPRNIEVGNEPDEPAPPAAPNPGLDLTELPQPAARPERKIPPLGEATADDLFGPLDEDSAPISTWEPRAMSADEPADGGLSPAPPPPPPPPAASPSGADPFDEPAPMSEPPVPAPAPEPTPTAEADPSMAGVVGFTAHGGTITGNIREKTKKLFGR